MSTLRALLQDSRDRIADPDHWTRRAFARDNSGNDIDYTDSSAVAFCAIGIVFRIYSDSPYNEMLGVQLTLDAADLLDKVAITRGWTGITEANDVGGHAEILKIYDAAIAQLSVEEEPIEASLFTTTIVLPETVGLVRS